MGGGRPSPHAYMFLYGRHMVDAGTLVVELRRKLAVKLNVLLETLQLILPDAKLLSEADDTTRLLSLMLPGSETTV